MPARRILIILFLTLSAVAQAPKPTEGLKDILGYIDRGWETLKRSQTECKTVEEAHPNIKEPPVLYIPAGMETPASARQLAAKCKIRVANLPAKITSLADIDLARIKRPGLLYLPNAYVVPGGMFNEMYGWDSYFILRGLVRDGRIDLARGIVENFFFEIEHYGAILNANRTYFLTRSQPPFLTSMIRAVYDADKAAGREDRAWLEKAYGYAARDHQFWTTGEHLAGNTGLSRYFDFGQGPAAEIRFGNDPYYLNTMRWFATHPEEQKPWVVTVDDTAPASDTPTFTICGEKVMQGASKCAGGRRVRFIDDYYKGDRSMRESGFDITFRFGPFAAATHHYAAVCLNSLLYKAEGDLEEMARMLDRGDDAARWKQLRQRRREAFDKQLWDAQAGLYFDSDFQTGKRNNYNYVTALYPLWVGLASPEQAKALVANLKVFEKPGGLAMSDRQTGVQWDLPYGWAPNQLIAIEGLRRYGFTDEANRLSYAFLSMVLENYRRDNTIKEKYNVVTRSDEVKGVIAGYAPNFVGFGWTNGTFRELLHQLPQEWRTRLEQHRPAKAKAATAN